MRFHHTRRLMALTALLAASLPAAAQDAWPTRPIRMLVPLAAGGGVDMMARLTAQHLSDQLGQQVVVENQGGAGGTIASSQVAHARPDGYTLIYQSVSSAVVNAHVYKSLSSPSRPASRWCWSSRRTCPPRTSAS